MDKNWQDVLDKTRSVFLLDMYGGLLTDKARETLSLYLNEDFSITEIAEELKVSRQAIHDSLQRSLEHLENFEKQLGVVASRAALKKALKLLSETLQEGRLDQAQALIQEMETGL